jgi:hypothetical protein
MSIEDAVNEGSSSSIEIGFFDEDGKGVVPTAASFSIVDVISGTEIQASKEIEFLSATIDLELTEDYTQIVDPYNAYEDRLLTVSYDFATDKHDSQEFVYTVKNLRNIGSDAPLIIETGEIVTDANSYVTLAETRSYASLRGITLSSDDAVLRSQLIKAMDYLESLRDKYQGSKVVSDQELQFPRDDVYIDNVLQDSESIPKLLKKAQMQLVIEIVAGAVLMPTRKDPIVKSEAVGPIKTEYFEGSSINPAMTMVEALLKPLFKTSSVGMLSVVRA